jgi:flagellar motor switch protein FliN
VEDEIEFMPLEPSAGVAGSDADLRPLHDVPVELAVEIGRTRMTIGETLQLRPGSVVSLNRLAGEPVDLLVNGKTIAHGEVVVIDEEFGLRVTDVVSSTPALEPEPAAAVWGTAEVAQPAPPAAVPPAPHDPLAGASIDDLPLGVPTDA